MGGIGLKCENHLCIYWEENQCLLEWICIDSQGHCQSCIQADIPEDLLAQAREKMRRQYEELESHWT